MYGVGQKRREFKAQESGTVRTKFVVHWALIWDDVITAIWQMFAIQSSNKYCMTLGMFDQQTSDYIDSVYHCLHDIL